MTGQRQDLLDLLGEAYVLAQNMEHLLTGLRGRHAVSPALAFTIGECLKQSLDQQLLLNDCFSRIQGAEQGLRLADMPVPANCGPQSADQERDGVGDELDGVRALIRKEIDIYSRCIATSESSGFFETKLACEGVLSQKLALASWLSQDNHT